MGATKFLYIHIKIFTKFAIYVNGESSHSECVNAGQRKCNWKMSATAMALLTIVGSSKVCATVCVCVFAMNIWPVAMRKNAIVHWHSDRKLLELLTVCSVHERCT